MVDQSSGYPSMPSGPAGQPVAAGPAPAPVLTAQKLMFLRAALGVLATIVVFATKGSLKSQILKNNPNYDSAKLDSVVNAAIVVGIVFSVIFLVLYVLLALQVAKGKNWARIVTFILAALGVLSALSALVQTETALSKVLAVIGGLIDIAIIVLLARGESGRYFKGASARR